MRYLFTISLTLATALGMAQTAAVEPPSPPVQETATTAPLAQRLDTIFDAPQWHNAHWGVLVKDLNTSTILYERNAAKSVMPASNMKLFTSAASLATLGADYRFETKIYATGTTDTAGTLRGNIYIVGSGDPSISGRYLDTPTTAILAQWADAVSKAGIKRIDGDVIGDDDIFDDRAVAGSWQPDYLQEWYAAENSGLAINDNCWDAILEAVPDRVPHGQTSPTRVLKVTNPLDTKYYVVATDVRITTDPATTSANLSIERTDNRQGERATTIKLEGSIPAEGGPEKEWGSVPNGTLFTVTLLKEELIRKNIQVTGNAVDIDDMDEQVATWTKANAGTLLHTHVSPPLPQILSIINKPSQNFYADMLLKVLGAKGYGAGSWSNGERVVEDLLTTAGADARSFNMGDGSGLSRRNLVEPNQVVALLTYMHTRPDFEVFEQSLPIMGVDGTLKGRMTGTAAEGNVKAKTGTIGQVRALSGYLTANNGHRIVFSMIANNYYVPTSAATEAQNNAILELINQ